MSITVFQEQVPFTNQKVPGQVSSGTYYNPIVMPLSFNVVSYQNFVEVVFYIRNNDPTKYYKDILCSLVTIGTTTGTMPSSVNFYTNGITIEINGNPNQIYKVSSSSEVNPTSGSVTDLVFPANYGFVSPGNSDNNSNVNVKFSYGYDELSMIDWNSQNEILYIPNIGNTTTYDMSYIPIRMRIQLLTQNPLYTTRNYSLDVTYGQEILLGS